MYEGVILNDQSEIMHEGQKYRSGRYPYGSGENPYQHDPKFGEAWAWREKYKAVKADLSSKNPNVSQAEIAHAMGLKSTDELRKKLSYNAEVLREARLKSVESMTQDGKSISEIAKRLNASESAIRKDLKAIQESGSSLVASNRQTKVQNIVDVLKAEVEEKGYIDVGKGSSYEIGVTETALKSALKQMEEEGYYVHSIFERNLNNPSHYTNILTLTKNPSKQDVWENHLGDIQMLGVKTPDGGYSFMGKQGLHPPKILDASRISIRYGNQGGEDFDGAIGIRRGAEGLDLGKSNYAQVRILTELDGGQKAYLKGMVFYTDDIPEGKDVVFFTNKRTGTAPIDVFKKASENADNPFGATIKEGGQRGYLNVVNEEGDWLEWHAGFPAQFLAKQSPRLVKDRLKETLKSHQEEHDIIMKVSNPVVRQELLSQYARGCETKARELRALATAGAGAHVILPSTKIKPNEVYAPNYENGERVALVRYPHGGPFEIADLVVNNRNKAAAAMIGSNAKDAIVLHPTAARKLSGADFDGDTVYVFKNNDGRIKTDPYPAALKDFDPKDYKVPGLSSDPGQTMSKECRNIQMGVTTNLIHDMTEKGATPSEKVRAVKHSMVVIDAYKHNLDYKKSYVDNGIQELREKYQFRGYTKAGNPSYGASTIVTRAKNPTYEPVFNEKTGEAVVSKKTGEQAMRKKYTMDVTADAMDLVAKDAKGSAKIIEIEYANYANTMKAAQNTAMKEAADIKMPKWNKSLGAKGGKYEKEIESLNKKYRDAMANKPRERQAQILTARNYNAIKDLYDNKEDKKRARIQVENAARKATGSKAYQVQVRFTPKEWEAIEAGAVSASRLKELLRVADMSSVKEMALPNNAKTVSTAMESRIKSMASSGRFTQDDIAKRFGISARTVSRVLAS